MAAPVEELKKAVSSFLLATSQNNVDVVKTFRKEHGKIVDKDMVRLFLAFFKFMASIIFYRSSSVSVIWSSLVTTSCVL